jgi:hypothetical protein
MIQDEILQETWRIRDEYARSFNYDLDAIFCDLKRREAQSSREHVKLPARKLDMTVAVGSEPERSEPAGA